MLEAEEKRIGEDRRKAKEQKQEKIVKEKVIAAKGRK